ncbi:MAG: DUF4404 family protein [Proteobacteria bacterium]|nr:DUF4404 family protein [Pseudomonadota bacterium]
MPRKQLHKSLQELRLELDKLHFEHEAQRDALNQQVIALEEKLRDESAMSADEYLIQELAEALEEFEEEHPRLTELVGRITDLLARMGI